MLPNAIGAAGRARDRRQRLRFTGTCSEAEFKRRCAEHDFWYHSYYFDNGFEQRGDYDIGADLAGYGFPEDMRGMSVLDIGTGSGWFATLFEQRGADVCTVDVRGYCDFDVYGRWFYPPVETEKPGGPDRVVADGRAIYYSSVSRGFWIMKDLLGLQAEYFNARVYEVRPELFGGRQFDLVFLGALLMHVRDPIGALMAARSVCRHRLIANSLKPPSEIASMPVMEFINSRESGCNWWRPNRAAFLELARSAGFREPRVDRTVDIVTDNVYVSPEGLSSGVTQTLYVCDATI